MGLEIPTGKTPGSVVRATPAPRPAIVGGMILALFAIQLLFFFLIFQAILKGANNAAAHDPAIPDVTLGPIVLFKNEQTIISFWISMTFFCLFAMILLYQRFFKDHVTIVKRRFRKWEDEGVQLHG